MSKQKKITINTYYFRAKTSGRPPQALVDLFLKIFENLQMMDDKVVFKNQFKTDEDRIQGKRVLVIIDAHACEATDLVGHLRLIHEVTSTTPLPYVLVIYDETITSRIPDFVRIGVHHFFSVPWDRTTLQRELKPLINAINHDTKYRETQTELIQCQKRFEHVASNNDEGCEELRGDIDAAKNFFAEGAKEMDRLTDELVNTTTIMQHTDLDEEQVRHMGSTKRVVERLEKLITELKSYTDMFNAHRATEAFRTFNINTAFDVATEAVRKKLHKKKLELIYDIDNSVPAIIYGNALLIGKVLIHLLEFMIDLDQEGEIVLRVSMQRDPDEEDAGTLSFEILDTHWNLKTEMGISADDLMKHTKISQVDEWITEMHGSFAVLTEDGKVPFTFSVPIKQMQKRSYRLPSKEWMNKRVLLIVQGQSQSNALKRMLGYFHFHIHQVASADAAKKAFQDEQYDMIFADDIVPSNEMGSLVSQRGEAKLVILAPHETQSKYKSIFPFVDAFLDKPFTQDKIFNTILEIFSEDSAGDTKESIEILKSNLSLLTSGDKKILFFGDTDSDWVIVNSLIEGTGIALFNVDLSKPIPLHLESADLIIISARLPQDTWQKAIDFYRTHQDKSTGILLASDREIETIDEVSRYGIETILYSPINPEYFYKTLLDVMLYGTHD